jgi:hypothetical protein
MSDLKRSLSATTMSDAQPPPKKAALEGTGAGRRSEQVFEPAPGLS